jgi:hypothetical protein
MARSGREEHFARPRPSTMASQTGREPPWRCRALQHLLPSRSFRPGHSEPVFVAATHHTCRWTRAPEPLPTPVRAFCQVRLRPETMGRFIVAAAVIGASGDWGVAYTQSIRRRLDEAVHSCGAEMISS